MGVKSGSAGLRWLAVLLLVASAVPMVRSWRAQDRSSAPPPAAVATDDPKWISLNQIEVQLRSGEGDDVLADLSKEVGVPLSWNSPLHEETEVATLTVPTGVSEYKVLATLRDDS